jgi:hypothetical protein
MNKIIIGKKDRIIDDNNQYSERKQKMIDFASMTFEELDQYIEDNVVDFQSAKVFIKKLAKVVLAESKILLNNLK